jgi:rhodanese-related sulfurtransferase
LFVAEQGPDVLIADIRPLAEAGSVLGHIPGSSFPGIERLERLAGDGDSSPLVLVSATGRTAANVALRLEKLGLENVAAMEGGLAAWRALGFSTSRDPAGVQELLHDSSEANSEPGPLTVERVRQHIGDPRFQAAAIDGREPEDWFEFLRNPPHELWEALLEHLVEPAHIGCGHIRLMLQHGEEYGIRKELILAYLRAFHRL